MVQTLSRDDETVLFLDEAAFPCFQTSDYCWQQIDGPEVVYNRRDNYNTLHVIAICSQRQYVAFQVFTQPPNREAIFYFLAEVLSHFEPDKKVVILLDNAGWHQSNLILDSKIRDVLLFNVPYCWEGNFIENTFSKMKALWRKRRVAKDTEEEIESLLEMLMIGTTEKDFGGYRR